MNRNNNLSNTLAVGQIVRVFGYEFEVIALQGAAVAPDGNVTEYFRGRVTANPVNDSIRHTGYADGGYSWRAR
jgi:hypothetical protein